MIALKRAVIQVEILVNTAAQVHFLWDPLDASVNTLYLWKDQEQKPEIKNNLSILSGILKTSL